MSRRTEGFTLVELVVALTLLGVLTAVLAEGLRLAARASQALEERASRAHEAHVAMHFLARQAEGAQRLSGEAGAMRLAAGSSVSLALVAEGELRLVHEGLTTVLARNLDAATFEYFAAGAWHESWAQDDGLPQLVRLRLAPGGELYIAPRLHAPRSR